MWSNEAYAQARATTCPTCPNWTAIRQLTAEGFNKLLANCSDDIDAGLKDLNGRLERELAKQKVLAK